MRYAIIGTGRISPNHIVAAQHNQLDIVAICDLEEMNMKDKVLKVIQTIGKCLKR